LAIKPRFSAPRASGFRQPRLRRFTPDDLPHDQSWVDIAFANIEIYRYFLAQNIGDIDTDIFTAALFGLLTLEDVENMPVFRFSLHGWWRCLYELSVYRPITVLNCVAYDMLWSYDDLCYIICTVRYAWQILCNPAFVL